MKTPIENPKKIHTINDINDNEIIHDSDSVESVNSFDITNAESQPLMVEADKGIDAEAQVLTRDTGNQDTDVVAPGSIAQQQRRRIFVGTLFVLGFGTYVLAGMTSGDAGPTCEEKVADMRLQVFFISSYVWITIGGIKAMLQKFLRDDEWVEFIMEIVRLYFGALLWYPFLIKVLVQPCH